MSAVTAVTYTGTVAVCETKACMICQRKGTVEVPIAEWRAWDNGNGSLIQNAMPSVSIADREMLMTGTHDECWDEIFEDEDEDSETYPDGPDLDYDVYPHDDLNPPWWEDE